MKRTEHTGVWRSSVNIFEVEHVHSEHSSRGSASQKPTTVLQAWGLAPRPANDLIELLRSKGNWSFLRLLSLTSRIFPLLKCFKFAWSSYIAHVISTFRAFLFPHAASLSSMLHPHCPFPLGPWRGRGLCAHWQELSGQSTGSGTGLRLPSRASSKLCLHPLPVSAAKFFPAKGSVSPSIVCGLLMEMYFGARPIDASPGIHLR